MIRKIIGMLFLPLLYACIVGTILRGWQHSHPIIAYGIFFFLCAMPVVYLISAVVQKVRRVILSYRLWKRHKEWSI